MPCGHMGTPIGAPISNIFARFHFVKLLPLRGRHVCMEVHIFARFHFVKLLPLRGRHVCMEVHIFARFHFVNFLFLRAPSGPLMGTLWAPMWVPYGAPTFQKINQLILVLVPAPSNQETTCWWRGGRRSRCSHHMPPADTPAHFGKGPP